MKPRRGVWSRRAKKAEGATMRHAHRFILSRLDNLRSVRRHIIIWMTGVALLIIAVAVQALWFQRSYVTIGSTSGGVYAEAMQGSINTLNPLYATTDAEQSARRLLFSSLFQYDMTGHLSDDLANSMKIDATGKVYTITIRPDAQWSDGTKVTAQDVAYTVKLMKDPTVRSAMISAWQDVNAKALDDTTVQFILPAPYAAFPQALTFSVLPQHILSNVDPRQLRENTFSSSPVGSGPFSFKLLQMGNANGHTALYLAANQHYYAHAPRLDRFQLHAYGLMSDIGTALQTGEVSSAADVSSDVARSVDMSRYTVISKPVNSGLYAILNTTRPLLQDVLVRRALQLATDTEAIRGGMYGSPKSLDLPFVNGQLTGSDVPTRAATSKDQANALLDQAGWRKGTNGIRMKNGQQLRLQLVTRKDNDMEYVVARLKQQWQAIGVAIDDQVVDTSAAGQDFTQLYLQPRSYDVLLDKLTIGADPDVFAYWYSKGLLNFSNYSDARSDDALLSARGNVDTSLRMVKYKAFARQWLSDVPAIGIYQSNMLYVKANGLSSMTNSESIVSPDDRFADVQFWTAQQGSVFKTP